MDQASQVFGKSSSVFNDLVNSYAPIVAAGPSQEGFSAPELAAKRSAAITDVGQSYKNSSQAVKEANAAVGGGNLAVTGGADIGRNLSVANASAAQTAGELNDINQQNFATGRQNYFAAAQGLAGAPNVFGAANTAVGEATGSGQAADVGQNAVAEANSSPWKLAAGALGALGGQAISSFSPKK
jgi:hypothetical protein